MKKLAIIIFLTLTGLSCSDAINDLFDELNTTVPVCVAFDSTAIAPDGRGWTNAYPTIAEGVDAAQPGQEIWVKAGTYNLSAILTIAKSVSIYGGFNGAEKRRNERSNDNQITIISQTLAGNILFDNTSAGKTILIDCFTIKGNHIEIILGASPAFNNCRFDKISYNGNGGALNMDDSSATISQCMFDMCEASTGSGGAIYANTASLNIVNSTFTSNVASSTSSNGGAIYAQNSNISVLNCSFTDNSSNYSAGSNGGGAMYIASTSLNISNTSFIDNLAQIHGGAIYVASNSTVAISNNSEFTSNSADNGGAIYAEGASIVMNIADTCFGLSGQDTTGNSATSNAGGAIYAYGGFSSLTISGCNFNYNTASLGGAIVIYDSTALTDDAVVLIGNTTFFKNSVGGGGQGGAINIYLTNSPKVTINNTNFTGNESGSYGGAVVCAAGEFKVNDCIFNNNKSTANIGGGLFLQYGNLYSIVNTIFYNNSTSGGSGGAIYYTTSTATHRFVNLTFYNNSATGNGGAIYVDTTSIDTYLYNTIIFGTGNCIHKNDNNTLYLNNCYYNSTLTTSVGSIVPNGECVDSSSNPFVSTTSTDTYFLYPNDTAGARNSGTTDTGVLPAGFIMPTTDLAGNLRVVNEIVDMGAYEVQ